MSLLEQINDKMMMMMMIRYKIHSYFWCWSALRSQWRCALCNVSKGNWSRS